MCYNIAKTCTATSKKHVMQHRKICTATSKNYVLQHKKLCTATSKIMRCNIEKNVLQHCKINYET